MKFRETVKSDLVFLKQSTKMDVVRIAIAILFFAPLALAAPIEVPEVQEFHEAMMNPDNGQERILVDELNVTSDTVKGYLGDTEDFFDEIRNGDDNQGVNFAAVKYIVLVWVVLIGLIVALCTACYCGGKKIAKEWRKKVRKDTVDTSDDSITATVSHTIVYIPPERSLFY